MDYHFTTDIYGQAEAKFSMGHEAIGRWLTEELGSNRDKVSTLITVVENIMAGKLRRHQQQGFEFLLSIDYADVNISRANDCANDTGLGHIGEHGLADDDFDTHNGLESHDGDALDDGQHSYDAEHQASCGLEDFYRALTSWQEFLAK